MSSFFRRNYINFPDEMIKSFKILGIEKKCHFGHFNYFKLADPTNQPTEKGINKFRSIHANIQKVSISFFPFT